MIGEKGRGTEEEERELVRQRGGRSPSRERWHRRFWSRSVHMPADHDFFAPAGSEFASKV